jgi:hypothetical protein
MRYSPEVEALLERLFPAPVTDQARRLLSPIRDDRLLHAILGMSDGDLERLQHFREVAEAEPRDVLLWAESPRDADEPRTYEDLRERLNLPAED